VGIAIELLDGDRRAERRADAHVAAPRMGWRIGRG
jgi:hypothetical protein